MSLELLYKTASFFVKLYKNKGDTSKTFKELNTTKTSIYKWINLFSRNKLINKKLKGRKYIISFTKKGELLYKKLKRIEQLLNEPNRKI